MAIYKQKGDFRKRGLELVNVIAAKAGFIGALYLGALYHQPIMRVIDRSIYGNTPIQQEFFQDPYGLKIEIDTNRHGKREVFLCYENKLIVPLTYQNISNLEKKVLNNECSSFKGVSPIPIKR